ncbi:FkbM family methyltransferase [Winogradskyella sp. R77965]|uniref:FkbM family methyltransferase n=1 Tax=Winogradskyella sp. R77965 TaxID=3093872 RepID=UPI0037DCFE24
MILKIKRFLKKKLVIILKNKKHLKHSVKCKKKWHGNQYGGFYINPDIMNKDTIVYSFGIGEDISFDLSIIEHYGCKVFGFDPTPKSIKWIKDKTLPKEFSFNSYGIGNNNDEVDFFLPLNEDFVSGSIFNRRELDPKNRLKVQLKNIRTIAEELKHNHVNVLKMDIEGSEYEVIESLFEVDLNFEQILIEFHDRFFKDGVRRSKNAISFLNSKGYEIFAISDNFEEISFINKSTLNN